MKLVALDTAEKRPVLRYFSHPILPPPDYEISRDHDGIHRYFRIGEKEYHLRVDVEAPILTGSGIDDSVISAAYDLLGWEVPEAGDDCSSPAPSPAKLMVVNASRAVSKPLCAPAHYQIVRDHPGSVRSFTVGGEEYHLFAGQTASTLFGRGVDDRIIAAAFDIIEKGAAHGSWQDFSC